MKIRQFPLLAVSLFFLSVYSEPLRAGASNQNGNPFANGGNGSFFPNSGTFSAIMRGPNLMGVTQFSIFQDGAYPSTGWNMLNGQSANTMLGVVGPLGANQNSSTNTFGSPGFVSLYYNGTTFNGPAFSVLNPASGEIASSFYTYGAGGQLWNPGNSPGSYQIVTVDGTVQVVQIPGAPITTNINASGPGLPVSSNQSVATSGPISYSGGSYNYYDGNWTAYFQNKYPNQTFQGSGVISLGQPYNATSPSPINQPNGGPNVVQISFQVSGVRVSSSTSKIY